MKIQLFLINRARASDSVGIDPALQFYEGPNMLSVMNVKTEHVSFVEVRVPVRRLSPIIISDLFPYFPGFSADRNEPIISPFAESYIFDRVPEIMTLGRISEKTPVLVLPQ